ncbi:MAG TPA: thioredoxin domain-containing protein [Polyangia bacterium]|jgi:protein-disulfide isomerase
MALLALVAACGEDAAQGQVAPPEQRQVVDIGTAPTRGPADAKVDVVEFGDYQCPYCGDEQAVVTQLLTAYDGRIRFAFKQFPLYFHTYAQQAAEAALAANAQGKFWDFHDALYAHQANLMRTDLESYAEQLGLDLDAFRAALDGHTFAADVAADVAQGTALGVPGTPTFFINGRMAVGAVDYAALAAAIDEELAR